MQRPLLPTRIRDDAGATSDRHASESKSRSRSKCELEFEPESKSTWGFETEYRDRLGTGSECEDKCRGVDRTRIEAGSEGDWQSECTSSLLNNTNSNRRPSAIYKRDTDRLDEIEEMSEAGDSNVGVNKKNVSTNRGNTGKNSYR